MSTVLVVALVEVVKLLAPVVIPIVLGALGVA